MPTSTHSDMNVRNLSVARLRFSSVVWKDMRFPLTRTQQGANNRPDFDYTNCGLLFPQNDTAEIAYLIAQINHDWATGTVIQPHLHFVQTSAAVPVFKMSYRWYDNGADATGAFTTIATTGVAIPYTSGSILQIAPFPEIDGSHITGVSSMLDIKLFRDDNVVTGDVLAKEFDIHIPCDSLGSEELFEKV